MARHCFLMVHSNSFSCSDISDNGSRLTISTRAARSSVLVLGGDSYCCRRKQTSKVRRGKNNHYRKDWNTPVETSVKRISTYWWVDVFCVVEYLLFRREWDGTRELLKLYLQTRRVTVWIRAWKSSNKNNEAYKYTINIAILTCGFHCSTHIPTKKVFYYMALYPFQSGSFE